jgi:general stress protein 26
MDTNIEIKCFRIMKRSGKTIVGSIDENGYPNIKAMLRPRKNEGIKIFYFSTNTSSLRVKQFRENANSSIYFFDRVFYKGLLLKGKMEVLEDQNIKNEIWKLGDTMYYSKGKTDPDYCILRFTAIAGRLYEKMNSVSFDID